MKAFGKDAQKDSWVAQSVNGRSLRVRVARSPSDIRLPHRGVPQGFTLEPLIILRCISGITSGLEKLGPMPIDVAKLLRTASRDSIQRDLHKV